VPGDVAAVGLVQVDEVDTETAGEITHARVLEHLVDRAVDRGAVGDGDLLEAAIAEGIVDRLDDGGVRRGAVDVAVLVDQVRLDDGGIAARLFADGFERVLEMTPDVSYVVPSLPAQEYCHSPVPSSFPARGLCPLRASSPGA